LSRVECRSQEIYLNQKSPNIVIMFVRKESCRPSWNWKVRSSFVAVTHVGLCTFELYVDSLAVEKVKVMEAPDICRSVWRTKSQTWQTVAVSGSSLGVSGIVRSACHLFWPSSMRPGCHVMIFLQSDKIIPSSTAGKLEFG